MIKIKDLIRRIRSMAHDQQAIEYSDDDLMLYINDGLRFVRRIVMDVYPSMLVDFEFDGMLDVLENTIYLFDPISHIIDVRVDGKPLKIINPRVVEDINAKGRPKFYWLVGYDKISVWPVPNTPVEFSVTGIKDLEPLTLDDEELPVPSDLEDFVYEYCILRASFTNEFDMSQESQLMVTIVNGIQQRARTFNPPGVKVGGYW